MNVTVRFTAQLGLAAGAPARSMEIETPCTAQDLVARVAREIGAPFEQLVLDEAGGLQRTVLLFIGDQQVAWDTPQQLADRDELLLVTPIAGG